MSWELSLFYGPIYNRHFNEGHYWSALFNTAYTSGTTVVSKSLSSFGSLNSLSELVRTGDIVVFGPSTNSGYEGIQETRKISSVSGANIVIDSALEADYEINDSISGIGTGFPAKVLLQSGSGITGAITYPYPSFLSWLKKTTFGYYRDTAFYTVIPGEGSIYFEMDLDSVLEDSSTAYFGFSVYSRYDCDSEEDLVMWFRYGSSTVSISHGVASADAQQSWIQYKGTAEVDFGGETIKRVRFGAAPDNALTCQFSNPVAYSLYPLTNENATTIAISVDPNYQSVFKQEVATPEFVKKSSGLSKIGSTLHTRSYKIGGRFFAPISDYNNILMMQDLNRRGRPIVLFHDLEGVPNPLVGALNVGIGNEDYWSKSFVSFDITLSEL